jgi:hypothetical protein
MGFLHFGQIGGGVFLGISGTHAKSGASITGLTVTDYCRDWGGDVLNLPGNRTARLSGTRHKPPCSSSYYLRMQALIMCTGGAHRQFLEWRFATQ